MHIYTGTIYAKVRLQLRAPLASCLVFVVTILIIAIPLLPNSSPPLGTTYILCTKAANAYCFKEHDQQSHFFTNDLTHQLTHRSFCQSYNHCAMLTRHTYLRPGKFNSQFIVPIRMHFHPASPSFIIHSFRSPATG